MKRIGLVAAWEPELKLLFEKYPAQRKEQHACWSFNFHILDDIELISVVSGVGKVKVASCTQLLISYFNPEELYMTGICGGLTNEIKGGDIVIAEQTLQHDVTDAGSFKDAYDII